MAVNVLIREQINLKMFCNNSQISNKIISFAGFGMKDRVIEICFLVSAETSIFLRI